MASQVAERTNRFESFMPLIVLCSNSLLNLNYPPSSLKQSFGNRDRCYLKNIFYILEKKHVVNGALPGSENLKAPSFVWMQMMKSYFIDSQLPHNI